MPHSTEAAERGSLFAIQAIPRIASFALHNSDQCWFQGGPRLDAEVPMANALSSKPPRRVILSFDRRPFEQGLVGSSGGAGPAMS